MDDISLRIQVIIDKVFENNKAKFSRSVGVPQTTLASYFDKKKKSKPSSDVLQKIVEKTGVDALWLLTGVGQPFKENPKAIQNNNGKVDQAIGNVEGSVYHHSSETIEKVEEEKIDVEVHSPDDLHKIEVLTIKVDSLTTENKKQEDTIADLRETIKDLRERIKELKAQKK